MWFNASGFSRFLYIDLEHSYEMNSSTKSHSLWFGNEINICTFALLFRSNMYSYSTKFVFSSSKGSKHNEDNTSWFTIDCSSFEKITFYWFVEIFIDDLIWNREKCSSLSLASIHWCLCFSIITHNSIINLNIDEIKGSTLFWGKLDVVS